MLTSDEPAPVALVGELLVTQAESQGVAGILVDGAVRDLDELREIGLPIWARFVRAQGATKGEVGKLDVPVVIGGGRSAPETSSSWTATERWRCRVSASTRCYRSRSSEPSGRRDAERYASGELSYDFNGLRELVEG